MLRDEIQSAINRNSAENQSDTPDYVLAQFLATCLRAFDDAVIAREAWYGRQCPGGNFKQVETTEIE